MELVQKINNIELRSSVHNKPILLDIAYRETGIQKPIVVFFHGFKGLKDWGPWHLMADYYAERNYVFLKFNFSHNGTTTENPLDFGDLEAFGNNNYSIEMDDAGDILDFIGGEQFPVHEIEYDPNHLFVVSHSRGGGLSIVKAYEDSRIKKLVTLAAVDDLAMWDQATLENWKEEGVRYILNGRTKQNMPLYIQLANNYYENLERLEISSIAPKVKIPWLIVHGKEDEAVPVSSAENLKNLNESSELLLINGANHTFGGSHPWEEEQLPDHLYMALKASHQFFQHGL